MIALILLLGSMNITRPRISKTTPQTAIHGSSSSISLGVMLVYDKTHTNQSLIAENSFVNMDHFNLVVDAYLVLLL